MLALLLRQPDHSRRIFGHGRATADLMGANDPIRSDQLQYDPPLHPKLPAHSGRSHSTPHLLDGLNLIRFRRQLVLRRRFRRLDFLFLDRPLLQLPLLVVAHRRPWSLASSQARNE